MKKTNQEPIEINGTRLDHFTTSVYKMEIPGLLKDAKKGADRALKKHKKENPDLDIIFPVHQTGDISDDTDIRRLAQIIADISFDTLQNQGYDMQNKQVYFSSMWVQEHFQGSGHAEHVHGDGAQLVGFYFLEVPEDSAKLVIHDPRPGKKQINLPQADESKITYASDVVNYTVKPGELYIINAFTPHSIGRNRSKQSLKLIHFTINIDYLNANSPPKGDISIDVDAPIII
jgi:hypothetical protein